MNVSMEVMEDMKASVEVNSTSAFTQASAKASMEIIEAFADVMEASIEVSSVEAWGQG